MAASYDSHQQDNSNKSIPDDDVIVFPVSFAQQRLWFLEQLTPGSPVYNIPLAIHLAGNLDIPALERSLSEIIGRHETLRTSFTVVDSQPVQIISAPSPLNLPLTDLSHLGREERERMVHELAAGEAGEPFDLGQAPLLRARLLRLGESEHVLLFTMHHIVSDGWSLGVLIREVSALYGAFAEGRPSPLEELPVQYADYAVWQRERLSGEVLEAQLGYWREQLGGAPAMLALPTDKARPAVQSYRGGAVRVEVGEGATAALRGLCRREGVTPFMVLLAAFDVLLWRWSGQEDVVVGTPVANRTRAEVEGLIGFFVNTLALRVSLAGNPSFRELMQRVREVCLGAYAHQEVPFEKLVEEIAPERSLSHTPVFQVILVLHNAPVEALVLPGLKLSAIESENATVKFDLALTLSERGTKLYGSLEYNTDLFERATVERMIGHLQTLLESAVANPDQLISDLPLLTTAEQHQLLSEWNNTRREYPTACLHELFEEQVERTPGATALVYEEERLSYRELNERANRLAHHLRGVGVGAESLVAVMMERSPEMVISLLAVLKAGGAYLPVDPAYPRERVSFMLEDASVSVLITTERFLEKINERETRVVCPDTEWATIATCNAENPHSHISVDNLAYVIYTSGSTGKPKGVTVSHGNVARLFSATEQWFRFNRDDVWTLFHSYAFDFSVWELWGALLYGGRLVIVPYLVSRSPDSFYDLLCREHVTVLNQTPSAFRQLMRAEQEAVDVRATALRLIIFGGEALDLQSLQPWFERHEDKRPQLVNMYGITETTVHVTYRPVLAADACSDAGSMVGVKIPDLELYVLDENLQLVPVGVAGEIYVGGGGLARGYLRRAGLTAARFIPHPYSQEGGARLYRTGDSGRWLPNADLEYLGRVDEQVKVRGFRIELGEIETALREHTAIREAVVTAHKDASGGNHLVAYIVAEEEQKLSPDDLQKYLRSRLPEYMVPAVFLFPEALPLGPGGKVNRRALPAPDNARPALEGNYVAPETRTEEVLAEVWAEVLGLERVGVRDNFFSLGGDSIRTIQVRSKAQERGINFSIQQLFQHQTVRELAYQIDGAEAVYPSEEKTERFGLISEEDREKLPREIEDAYPVTSLQMGMLFHSAYDYQPTVYHNVNSFELQAPFDPAKLETTLQQLAARHAILRTSFELGRFSEPLQLVHRTVRIPLQVDDLSPLSHDEQEEVLREWFEAERTRPFNIKEAPLLRFHIHRRSEETFQFSFTEHHAILDGWSVASMLTELFKSYSALLVGQEYEIAPPKSVFRDYVASERKALESEECRVFWEQKLSGSPMTTIPRWSSTQREDVIRRGRKRRHLLLPAEVSEALQRLSRDEGIPLKSILLAAHLKVLSLLSGQTDVVTGLVSSGRIDEGDGDRVLGLFLNNLPFRLEVSGSTWLELIRETFETERELLSFRHYPLSELQKAHSRRPLFETTFNFVHFHIYESIAGFEDFELLGAKIFGETEAPFVADFGVNPSSRQVELRLSGRAQEFGDEQIEATGDYYLKALAAMARDPRGSSESQWPLSAPEAHRILVEWNDTRTDYPPRQTAHELFEAQVERTPEATALIYKQERLSYRELNERANQLAHYLQGMGIGPEMLAAICLERSTEMVISLLAVLKAGAAYVPLDPEYPPDRLSFMLFDSSATVLLTQERLSNVVPGIDAEVVCVDSRWSAIQEQSRENPVSKVNADNLAYVIYTSGSTGRPKGVMVAHRSVCNLAQAQARAFHLSGAERVLQFASLSFDASVSELFKTWARGGTLCLAEASSLLPGNEFLKVLREERISVATLPASVLRAMPSAELPQLQKLIVAGEACRGEDIDRWQQEGRNIFNAYGPTETTVCATIYECPGGEERPPIGRAIGNVELYVLDENLGAVGIGITGEIYIGGVGVARGYLRRAGLTAARFIPHPYSKEGGARLYRTGDSGRWLPNADLEYLGRVDEQVKVRGFRIELAEVEVVLGGHPSVRECVVLARKDETRENRLAAYVVTEADARLTVNALRRHLQEKLPEYMIPSSFVMLAELPLTPTGKIDRQALPDIDGIRPELEVEYVAPRTTLEQALARMWAETLGSTRVGVHDNFFDAGGDSIKGAVLINRLQEALGEYVYVVALFDAPTVAALAAYLNTHYAEAVLRMCPPGSQKFAGTIESAHAEADEGRDAVSAGRIMTPIVHVPRDQKLPLSFAQQRLWFLDKLAPDSAAYNIPVAVRLNGTLDLHAMQQTFDELLRRHETLRTSFSVIESQPVQLISAPEPFHLPLTDLSHLEERERERMVQQLSAAEAAQPFDLTVSRLLRARLLRLSADEHVLLFTMHHIISDGWSMGILVREVAALYAAFSRNEPSPLPDLPVQYADYSVWQREQLQGAVLEEQLAYWREQLSGAPGVLELPTDRPRPAVQSYRGAEVRIEIEEETADALHKLRRREGATLFMLLLAAFDVLLWRWSGQQDVVVGSSVAGRTRVEVEGLIGFFVNTLALRVSLEGNPTFKELLGRVKEAALGAYAHQDVPFERVVEELAPERDLSRTPVFQVMMVLQNAPREELVLPGLKLSTIGGENAPVKFDLSLILLDGERGIEGWLRYNANLFDASTVERMLKHWRLVLRDAAAAPEKRLSELSLLDEAERRQVLYEWNDTRREYPSQCIHELFEEQVERTPGAAAVVFKDRQVSYAELNARANRLAHHLRTLGIGPDVPVGISMERSVEMIVAILGVLKAGGAYVPLDPTYPQQRLSFMLEDTGVPVLLTQAHLAGELPAHWGYTLCLDSELSAIAEESTANPPRTVSGANLAYVIYTSGSTGRPKGVMVAHRSVCNLAQAQARAFHLSGAERVLQFASLSFDASVSELFKTWARGGTLCLAEAEALLPVQPLLTMLRREQITVVTLPPSVLRALPAAELPELHRLIVAGETCRAEELARWQGTGRRLFNAYGPTEATVCATVHECAPGETRPPIGRAISNTRVYILDEQMKAVAIGITGELYIGGMGVARGYWQRAELTAAHFLPDPYSVEAGARMYRTGDRARWRADGTIEYVGREDEQVKIRGFRIELGEVEDALRKHRAIRDAVVIMKEDATGEKRLIGYVVGAEDEQVNINEVRRHLEQRLPGHMVPSLILKIDEMPMTGNGKLDRRALPEPESSRPELEEEYVAPRTKLEETLAGMWAETLGITQVGIHDNFFDVGGDSIKGAVLINRLQEEISEYVHVVALFDAPTIARLAAYLTEHFPEDVTRFCGEIGSSGIESVGGGIASEHNRISAVEIAEVRQLIVPLKRQEQEPHTAQAKNPPAIFVLSPPRSGSTLLRVILGGHPALFAPPELELLSFNTLAERKAALAGRYSFWLEGAIRALMQIKHCTAEEAKLIMQECEERRMTTSQFYRLMQEWIGDGRLVDKTPSYALDIETLKRAEVDFEDALYIHLLRHPQGMLRSFEEARLEQVFFRYEHHFTSRQLGEIVWVLSHENILEFLKDVPQERQHRVQFEALVKQPRPTVESLCAFLGVKMNEEMLEPYREKENRMTDGIHPLSKMLGDVKFHEHRGIEKKAADSWRQKGEIELGELTWRMAESLGYHRENKPSRAAAFHVEKAPTHIVAIQPHGSKPPLFCVHPVSGHIYCYTSLARCLDNERPLYGIQSPSLFEQREPFGTVAEMAAYYVETLRAFHPDGPYFLAGHSSGGQVAFEMALALERQGEKVALLALFDTDAISGDGVESRRDGRDDAILLAGMLKHTLPLSLTHMQGLDSEERLLYIIEMAKQHNLVPPNFQPTQARRFLRTLRANVEASAAYAPEKYGGRITLFRASERIIPAISYGETLGWGSVAAGSVELHVVPGNHVTMIEPPNVQVLADLLKTCLQKAQIGE